MTTRCQEIDNFAELIAYQYSVLTEKNRDPLHPELPRLRLKGNVFYRVPDDNILNQLLEATYVQASLMGYKGGLRGWSRKVRKVIEKNPQN
jgi:hypothetical protein